MDKNIGHLMYIKSNTVRIVMIKSMVSTSEGPAINEQVYKTTSKGTNLYLSECQTSFSMLLMANIITI